MRLQKVLQYIALIAIFSLSHHAIATPNRTELKILTDHLPENFEFGSAEYLWSSYVLTNMVEGLMSTNAKGELELGQAESWSVSDDGTQYRFKLRGNIFWSDGKPVIADDFVLAWHRIVDPKGEGNYQAFLQSLENYDSISSGKRPLSDLGVVAVDQKTLLVTLTSPTGHFIKLLTSYRLAPLPSHYSAQKIDKMLSGESEQVVVNGPYTVQSFSDQEIRLSKNPYYWDSDQVYYDKVIYSKSHNPDGKSALNKVLTGKYDISIAKPQDAYNWARKMYPEYFQEHPSLHTEYYLFNTDINAFAQHEDVREALSMVIDREKLSRRIFKGSVKPTHIFTPKSLFTSHPPSKPDWANLALPERFKRASQILKKRGISPETPVSIELKTQNQTSRKQVAMAIKFAWKKLGVNANIVTVRTPDMYKQVRLGEFEVARGAWVGQYPDPFDFLSTLGGKDKRFAGISIKDPKINKLLAQAKGTVDQKQRELIFKQIEEINHKRNLILPLYTLQDYVLRSPKIQGVGESPVITSMRWVKPVDLTLTANSP